MTLFANLEQRFDAAMADLYSLKTHPYKDAATLEPIVVFAPNDPNRPQGTANTDREVPVKAVLTDEKRMTKLLTSPRGLRFMLKQQLLQTGNAIAETRILNPLFINENLSPYVHARRALRDQTDVVMTDADRSPASTPEVGVSGRLQKETGASALSHIMGNKTARQAVLDVLSTTQIAQTISGIVRGVKGDTYGVNQRPELGISGRDYSAILYLGRKPMLNRELGVLIDALGVAGVAGSIIGLPNIFAGLRGKTPLFATPNFSTGGSEPLGAMPYFNPDTPGITESDAGRYVQVASTHKAPTDVFSALSALKARGLITSGLKTILSTITKLAGLGRVLGQSQRLAAVATFKPTITIGPDVKLIEDEHGLVKLRKPERSLRQRYDDPDGATTVLSPESRDRIAHTKTELEKQRSRFDASFADWADVVKKRGVLGGITPTNIKQFQDDTPSKLHSLGGHYYQDVLNANFPEIAGTELPVTNEAFPKDLIDVHFVDVVNSRVIPFRAFITDITETATTTYLDTSYIGRIERNIVFLAPRRSLGFTLKVHAFSPAELQPIWQRINSLTGFVYPAAYSPDGFMVPPLIKLTIGDFYKDQPGYLTQVVHQIENDVSWETQDGLQVPMTVMIQLSFAVIEKEAMNSQSPFYGFGVPQNSANRDVFAQRAKSLAANSPNIARNANNLPGFSS